MSQKEEERKVFVQGLPPIVSEERLKAFFSLFGPVQDLNLRHHPKDLFCLGHGIVTFWNKKTAQKLINCKVYFDESLLHCSRFYSGEALKLNIELENKLKLLIFGLPPTMTSEELEIEMSFFKVITRAYVVLNRRFVNRNKGYGVLVFKSEPFKNLFLKCYEEMGLFFNGRKLSVSDNLSDPRRNLDHPHHINFDDNFSISQPRASKSGDTQSPKIQPDSEVSNHQQTMGSHWPNKIGYIVRGMF